MCQPVQFLDIATSSTYNTYNMPGFSRSSEGEKMITRGHYIIGSIAHNPIGVAENFDSRGGLLLVTRKDQGRLDPGTRLYLDSGALVFPESESEKDWEKRRQSQNLSSSERIISEIRSILNIIQDSSH